MEKKIEEEKLKNKNWKRKIEKKNLMKKQAAVGGIFEKSFFNSFCSHF